MPSSQFDVIESAMRTRKQIICVYNGLHREICPHTLGWKNGREKVLGFQFSGQSSKGLPPDGEWRCMFIDEIQNLNVREGAWHTSGPHTQPQTCVDEVHFEVVS